MATSWTSTCRRRPRRWRVRGSGSEPGECSGALDPRGPTAKAGDAVGAEVREPRRLQVFRWRIAEFLLLSLDDRLDLRLGQSPAEAAAVAWTAPSGQLGPFVRAVAAPDHRDERRDRDPQPGHGGSWLKDLERRRFGGHR